MAKTVSKSGVKSVPLRLSKSMSIAQIKEHYETVSVIKVSTPHTCEEFKKPNSVACFICNGPEAPTDPLITCEDSCCSTRLHISCASKYGKNGYRFQYYARSELTGNFLCPAHFCDHHQSGRRLHTAIAGQKVKCSECVRAWHPECIPADAQRRVDEDGNEVIVCGSHHSKKAVRSPVHLEICSQCDEGNDENNELLKPCATCPRSFHVSCLRSFTSGKLRVTKELQCRFCAHQVSPRLNRIVYFLDGQQLRLGVTRSWDSKKGLAPRQPGAILVQRFVEAMDSEEFIVTDACKAIEVRYAQLNAIDKLAMNNGVEKPIGVRYAIRKHSDENKDTKSRFVRKVQLTKNNIISPKLRKDVEMKAKLPDDCESTTEDYCVAYDSGFYCEKKECRYHFANIDEEGLRIASAGLKGQGVFATKEFKKSDPVCSFNGVIMDYADYNRGEAIYDAAHDKERDSYAAELQCRHTDVIVQPLVTGSIGRYINESHAPNATFCQMKRLVRALETEDDDVEFGLYEHYLMIKALRKIKIGEEISISYGQHYRSDYKCCACGAENCPNPLRIMEHDEEKRYRMEKVREAEKENEGNQRPSTSAVKPLAEKNGTSARAQRAAKRENNTSVATSSKRLRINSPSVSSRPQRFAKTIAQDRLNVFN